MNISSACDSNINHNYIPIEFVLIMANVIFFMVVQILFFKIIASKEVDEVIEKKSNILSDLLDNNPILSEQFDAYYASTDYTSVKKTSEQKTKKRDAKNEQLIIDQFCSYIRYAFYLLMFWVLIHITLTQNNRCTVKKPVICVLLLLFCGLCGYCYYITKDEHSHGFYTRFFSRCLIDNKIELSIICILICIVIVLLFFPPAFLQQQQQTQNARFCAHHWMILSLVLFVYVAEFLFYLFILRQHEFYPDQKIYNAFVDSARNGLYSKDCAYVKKAPDINN